jgi:hypothetical protein
MAAQEHSAIREGFGVGLIGAGVVALWYIVCDLLAGRQPLFTFNALGHIFIGGELPDGGAVDPGAVLGFLALLLVVSVLAGWALTLLSHLASRNPSLRMGVWLGLVITFCLFLGHTHMLNLWAGGRLPLWEILIGTTLSVVIMGWILWRRHPGLRRSFEETPLGDEVRTPGHAPERPRV